MKRLVLAALALLLTAAFAPAHEMPRHPLTGETADSPFGPVPGGGQINIYNYDWVPYRIEVHPHSFRLVVLPADQVGRGIFLAPGSKLSLGSPQHTWEMQGDVGSVTVGVYSGHNADVDLNPEGEGGGVGLRVEVKSHRHRAAGVIMAPTPRSPMEMAPPPPVEPYQPPIPVIPQSPYPVPVIGQDPPPIPVVGVDPPSPYWSGPHLAPAPQPGWGTDHPYHVPPPPPWEHHHRRHGW